MANVFLIGLDPTTSAQIGRALGVERHRVELKPENLNIDDTIDVDMIFAGGDPSQYLKLLLRVRERQPTLPFIVVSRTPETGEWLDALEAGATDYCALPLRTRQLSWLMESALPKSRTMAA